MTNDTVENAIGRSQLELDQPSFLPQALNPLTRALFTEAGIQSGMRVLDVWSGGGDVALLAREFVGSDGQVTGFDQSAGMVAHANERALFRGLCNVEFVEGDVENLPFGQDFDAIVGRTVLMYRLDPVRDLQTLVRCLRPGGLIVFQEFDMLPGRTVPPAAAVDDVRAWLLDFFLRAGIEVEMGPKLYSALNAAGLNAVQMRVDGFIGGSESICPKLVADVARMLLPQADALGVIKAEEVEIDDLEDRMRADLSTSGGVMLTPLLIGAWASLPG